MCKSEIEKKLDGQNTVEDKLGRVTRLMRQVRDVGGSCRHEDVNLIQRRMIQIITELEDIKDDLENLVTNKLSPRQMEFLKETDGDNGEDNDPSVQFFGVEWNSVFAKCFTVGLNIRIFKQRLAADCVDISGLACILTDLGWVKRQMELHSVALESGVLSQAHFTLELQQKLVITAGEAKRSSVKYGDNQSARQLVKYNRKHKTEKLPTLRGNVPENEKLRRKSVAEINSRKPSFLSNVSNLLNYIKQT